jgi:hypothetical protein
MRGCLCGFLQHSCCILLTVVCRQFLGIVEAGTWFLYLKKSHTTRADNLLEVIAEKLSCRF